jgi:hypothetical protein
VSNELDSALVRLRERGLAGTEEDFAHLKHICAYDIQAVECVGETLLQTADGQICRLLETAIFEAVANALRLTVDVHPLIIFYASQYDKWGSYKQTAQRQADFQRGLWFTALFTQIEAGLSEEDRQRYFEKVNEITHARALLLMEVGHLAEAEAILRNLAFEPRAAYGLPESKIICQYIARQNLSDLLVLNGRLREAEQVADGVVQALPPDALDEWGAIAENMLHRLAMGEYAAKRDTSGANPYAARAVARAWQGKVRQALADFKQAEIFQKEKLAQLYKIKTLYAQVCRPEVVMPSEPQALTGHAALQYAHLLTRLGKLNTAWKILDYSHRWAAYAGHQLPGMAAWADLALSDVYRLRGECDLAQNCLDSGADWAAAAGQKELLCWSQLSAARLALAQNNLTVAAAAADQAYATAVAHQFNLYALDALVTAGRIAFVQQNLDAAQSKAKAAVQICADPDFAYAWGRANAYHLLGEILLSQRENIEMAAQFLTGAVKIRKQIEDPRLRNSQALLAQIPNTT